MGGAILLGILILGTILAVIYKLQRKGPLPEELAESVCGSWLFFFGAVAAMMGFIVVEWVFGENGRFFAAITSLAIYLFGIKKLCVDYKPPKPKQSSSTEMGLRSANATRKPQHVHPGGAIPPHVTTTVNTKYANQDRTTAISVTAKKSTPPVTSFPPKSPAHKEAIEVEGKPLLSGRYADHGDGTVTDIETGLRWMRCALGQEHLNYLDATDYQFLKALEAINKFNEQGGYAGYQDWRLPTIEELKSLVFCSSGLPQRWNRSGQPCEGKFERATIDQSAFPNALSAWFWSSSVNDNKPNDVWLVHFYYGGIYSYPKTIHGNVRLVRRGK